MNEMILGGIGSFRPKFRRKSLLKTLGFPFGASWPDVRKSLKSRMVNARKRNDMEEASAISQACVFLKRVLPKKCSCGLVIHKSAVQCKMCSPKNTRKGKMRAIVCLFLALVGISTQAQTITNFGAININYGLKFDDPNTNRTDIVGYLLNVYPRGITNGTPLLSVASVTNQIPSSTIMGSLPNGKKWCALYTLAKGGQNGVPSKPVWFESDFNGGEWLPPVNIQLFLLAIATNSIPLPPIPSP